MGDGIQKKYALIVNGDQEQRHLDNVDRAQKALLSEDPNYHISVASPKKPSKTPSSFTYTDLKSAQKNRNSLNKLIKGIKSKMDDDDLFVLYVTGHGNKGKKGEGCIDLGNTCYSLETFAKQLNTLKYGKRFLKFDGCHTGSSFSLFADKRSIVDSLGSTDEVVSCQQSSPYFWSDKVTDQNSDGIITIQERFQYSNSQGTISSLVQYFNPFPNLSLSGKTAKSSSFSNKVATVHNDRELKKELKKLQPGQLALVMFSADWCGPCKTYFPTFESLAKKFDGKYLMIRAEGINGSEEEWKQYGANGYPQVAFINWWGKVTFVDDRDDPLASLVKTALNTKRDQINYYTTLLESPNAKLRVAGLWGIFGTEEKAAVPLSKIEKLLSDKDPAVVDVAIAVYLDAGGKPHQVIAPLEKLLKAKDPIIVRSALHDLKKLGPEAKKLLPQLEKLLGHSDPYVVLFSGMALRNTKLKTAKLTPALGKLLKDPDTQVVWVAASMLGGTPPKEANQASKFLEDILDHSSPMAVGVAIRSLILIGKKDIALKALPYLKEFLRNPDEQTLKQVVYAIKDLKDSATPLMPALTKLLRSKNDEIKRLAIRGLAYIGPPAKRFGRKIQRFLGSKNEKLVVEAIFALGDTGYLKRRIIRKLTRFLRHKSNDVLEATLIALGQAGPKAKRAMPKIIKLLEHDYSHIALQATHALIQIEGHSPRVLKALREQLKYISRDFETYPHELMSVETIVEFLGRSNDPEDIFHLIRFIHSDDPRELQIKVFKAAEKLTPSLEKLMLGFLRRHGRKQDEDYYYKNKWKVKLRLKQKYERERHLLDRRLAPFRFHEDPEIRIPARRIDAYLYLFFYDH